MEFLIGLFSEFIGEFIFESAAEGMVNKKVPIALRILCGILMMGSLVGIILLAIFE